MKKKHEPNIKIERHHGSYLVTEIATHATSLYQSDWDYPSLAMAIGWVPCRKCRETDGTVACSHHSASEMIASAQRFIDNHTHFPVYGDPDMFIFDDASEAK